LYLRSPRLTQTVETLCAMLMNNILRNIMKNKPFYTLLLFSIILYSCNSKKDRLTYFEFTYSNFFDTSFTLQSKTLDTILVRQVYHGAELNFKALLTEKNLHDLNNEMKKIEFSKVGRVNEPAGIDGESYYLKICINGRQDSILVYSDNVSSEIIELGNKMKALRQELEIHKL